MIETIASIGLVAIGSLLTLIALLSLAWSRVSGFRVSIGGVRFVDRGERLPVSGTDLNLPTLPLVSGARIAMREADYYDQAKERGE